MDPATTATRTAAAIEALCGMIARHGLLRRLAGPLIVLLWGRVRRIGAEVGAVLARMQAGRLRRYPARRPPRRSAVPRRSPTRSSLPRNSAWLVALVPETAASAAQWRHLLAEPELPAMLAAAPQLRRALRPLCHMLGVSLPPNPPAPSEPVPAVAAPSTPKPPAPQPPAPKPAMAAGPARSAPTPPPPRRTRRHRSRARPRTGR